MRMLHLRRTMNSLPSKSEYESSVFAEFYEGVRCWIWQQNWSKLRPIQESAAGKTESAFLPIASRLGNESIAGIGCLCISPRRIAS